MAILMMAIFIPLMLFAFIDRAFVAPVQVQGVVTAQTPNEKSFHSVGTIQGDGHPRYLPLTRGDLVTGQEYLADCKIGRISNVVLYCNPYERIHIQGDQ